MSRSRRKSRKTPASGEAEGAESPPPGESASPAFATAHRFADDPEARSSEPVAEGPPEGADATAETGTAAGEPGTAEPDTAEAAMADERPGAGTDPHATAGAAPEPAEAGYRADSEAGAADADVLPPEHDGERTGFATVALMTLLGIIAVAALTLWLAPKLAPHLPGPVARYLAPGQSAVEERLAELEARIGESRTAFEQERAAFGEERAALTGRIEDLRAEVEALRARLGDGPGEQTRAGLEAAAGERADLAERVEGLESALGNMRSELAAVNDALAEAESGEGPTTPELAAALAQLRSRVDALASDLQTARAGTDERIAGLSDRVDQALSRTEAAEAGRAEAEAESERMAAAAALREALAALETRFARGEPYAEPLGEVARLSGSEAPERLAAGAESGLPTTTALAEELSRVARDALAAARRSRAADGALGGIGSWLRAQVAGRPIVETAGDSVGAILSRVEARLEEGDPRAALAEVESLPEPSRAAIGGWIERLRARAAAERALAEWRAGLSAAG